MLRIAMTPRGHLGDERVEQHKPVLGSLNRLSEANSLLTLAGGADYC